jgi:hypothetical protein
MGYMNLKSEIGIENMPGKWTSWILNFEIDMSMIWPANDMSWIWPTIIVYQCKHILYQWQENEICELWFWNSRTWNFDFGIVHFGILILEFSFWNSDVQIVPAKHNTKQFSPHCPNHSMASAPGYLCRCDPNQRACMLSELRDIFLSQLCTLPK